MIVGRLNAGANGMYHTTIEVITPIINAVEGIINQNKIKYFFFK